MVRWDLCKHCFGFHNILNLSNSFRYFVCRVPFVVAICLLFFFVYSFPFVHLLLIEHWTLNIVTHKTSFVHLVWFLTSFSPLVPVCVCAYAVLYLMLPKLNLTKRLHLQMALFVMVSLPIFVLWIFFCFRFFLVEHPKIMVANRTYHHQTRSQRFYFLCIFSFMTFVFLPSLIKMILFFFFQKPIHAKTTKKKPPQKQCNKKKQKKNAVQIHKIIEEFPFRSKPSSIIIMPLIKNKRPKFVSPNQLRKKMKIQMRMILR